MNIEIYEFADGNWAYRIKNKGRILVHSEGYDSKWNAQRGLNDFMHEMKVFCNSNWSEKIKIEGS